MSNSIEEAKKEREKWISVMYTSKDQKQNFGAYACEWAETLYGERKLFYCKMMGSHSAIKGFMAACQLGQTLRRSMTGMREVKPCVEKGSRGSSFTEKLPSGSFLGIWVSSEDRFLLGKNDDHLFQMLRERFTLPALPEWGSIIIQELRNRGHIDELNTHRCKAAYINCEESEVDKTISDLVASGKIAF